jgi:heptosyltransferase I
VNILIVKLSALGDVIHTLPALTALRRAHPTARINWLIEATAAPLVLGHPALDQALVWQRRQFAGALRSGHWLRALGLLRSFVRELRAVRYDLVLDFQALLKSAVWVALARGVRKVGFGPGMARSEGSYLFLNERVPAVSMEVHALDRGLMLLEAIGIPRGTVVYDLPIAPETRRQAEQLLHDAGIGPHDRYVALHPRTRWPTKHWCPERFAAVADALPSLDCRAVFTGAPEDRRGVDEVFACLKRPAVRLDGKLDLKTLAALFQRASLVVSTDTGPMHLAAAVNTPVVAIFGPTAPQRTGPYGPRHKVVRAEVACSPCFSRQCRSSVAEEMACMKRIETDDVIHAIRELLTAAVTGSGCGTQGRTQELRRS